MLFGRRLEKARGRDFSRSPEGVGTCPDSLHERTLAATPRQWRPSVVFTRFPRAESILFFPFVGPSTFRFLGEATLDLNQLAPLFDHSRTGPGIENLARRATTYRQEQ
jgi:hypothetical protein